MPEPTRGVPLSGGGARITPFVADQVATIPASATLLAAAEELVAGDVGLLVVGTQDDVRGVISERDIVRAVGTGLDPATTPVMDVAHTGLVWCRDTATVHDAALLMMAEYVRHVLVEEDGRLLGVVSARDLLGAYVSGDPDVAASPAGLREGPPTERRRGRPEQGRGQA